MVLLASCSNTVVVITGNCRHKIKVLDIPLGGDGLGGGGGGGGQWPQMTSV